MATKIFINLPVKNLEKSTNFFTNLGFTANPQFSDDKATCLVISESIYVMLLIEEYFATFTKKSISDAKTTTEVLIALDAASKEEVQSTIEKAKNMGGEIYADAQDYGWMYQHGFADLDGHQWKIAYMDVSQMPAE